MAGALLHAALPRQMAGARHCLACLLSCAAYTTAGAQGRVVERHTISEPEGRILAFYSAAVAFTPLGAAAGAARRAILAVEGSYIPYLNAAQRRPGMDKPESTNLAPVFARPRVSLPLPAGLTLEASWVPPITIFDVKANIVGVAISRTLATARGITIAPRVAVLAGKVEGAITCNAETAGEGNRDLLVYYANICHARDSRDHFQPRQASADVVASRAVGGGSTRAYLAAGARLDRSRFDIGVIRPDGSRDLDHPIIEINTTRPQFAAGVIWLPARMITTTAEWFYAPGSMSTIRLLAGWRLP